LYNHGLFKILIIKELKKGGDNWDAFLYQNGFISKIGLFKGEPCEPIILIDKNNKNNHEGINSHGVEDFTILYKTHKKDPSKTTQRILITPTIPTPVTPTNTTPITPSITTHIALVTHVMVTRSIDKIKLKVKTLITYTPCSLKNLILLDLELTPNEQSNIEQLKTSCLFSKKPRKESSQPKTPSCTSPHSVEPYTFIPHDMDNTTYYYEPIKDVLSSMLERKYRRIDILKVEVT